MLYARKLNPISPFHGIESNVLRNTILLFQTDAPNGTFVALTFHKVDYETCFSPEMLFPGIPKYAILNKNTPFANEIAKYLKSPITPNLESR